ncbi:uncharacterized protein DEA37_0013850 [Paragonimus westermani]|uniref:Leucine-rich repeat-containing protein 74 n=1 Tax=Paragonimus westermani TaxID=34504 RepID=A0A5J4P398_9TREM|nr:uncharacterized protein DEA37_0013850 [Paragonimus westermani]
MMEAREIKVSFVIVPDSSDQQPALLPRAYETDTEYAADNSDNQQGAEDSVENVRPKKFYSPVCAIPQKITSRLLLELYNFKYTTAALELSFTYNALLAFISIFFPSPLWKKLVRRKLLSLLQSVSDLCNMLKENMVITELNLSENHLTSKCAENLCDVLASSAQIERIDLHGNRFDDKSGIYFSELMATSLRMSYLNLSYNNFGDVSTVQFGRALPQATSLVELNLSWNRLGSGGMRPFAKGLAVCLPYTGVSTENKYLRSLNLSFNGIGPRKGCPELALTLKGNKALEVLDISGNRISPEGAVLFCKGFYNNTTLKHLYGILVNQDFRQLQDEARIKLPKLVVRAGKQTTEQIRALSPKFQQPDVSPKFIVQTMGRVTKQTLADVLKPLDPPGDKVVTRQAFIKMLYVRLFPALLPKSSSK